MPFPDKSVRNKKLITHSYIEHIDSINPDTGINVFYDLVWTNFSIIFF